MTAQNCFHILRCAGEPTIAARSGMVERDAHSAKTGTLSAEIRQCWDSPANYFLAKSDCFDIIGVAVGQNSRKSFLC